MADVGKWTFNATPIPDGFIPIGTMSDDAVTIVYDNAPPRPKPPMCPHCGRDWHPGPLTLDVATMLQQHLFWPEYDLETDVSPIMCVGAEFHGPNRLNSIDTVVVSIGGGGGGGPGWKTLAAIDGYTGDYIGISTFKMMDETIKAILAESTLAFEALAKTMASLTIKLSDWGLVDNEKPCSTDDLHIEFGPDNWVVKPLESLPSPVPYSVHQQLRQIKSDEWQAFPVPESPGYDFSTYAEDIKYPTSKGVLK
jgi:hypothetical protein